MSAAPVPVPQQPLSVLSSRQREIIRLARDGRTLDDIRQELGISLSAVSSNFYAAMARLRGTKAPASRRWDRDADLDSETPREARARVARELAEGLRCRHPMLSGAPCSLLLPCHTHGGR